MGPPPYQHVTFASGYTHLDPFGSGNFVVDPQTGFISVTPRQIGIFVLAISVFEYRNGQLLSEQRRDFQIHILPCKTPTNPPVIRHDLSGLNHQGDTIIIPGDRPFCYDVEIIDPDSNDVLTAYTVSAGFTQAFSPPATFIWSGKNPIRGKVCWQPPCELRGQVIPLILGARDTADCRFVADVFDTVWVRIDVPQNIAPKIQYDTSAFRRTGDTLLVAADSAFCIDFSVQDANATDSLYAFPISPIFNDPDPPSFSWTGVNPLRGRICWRAGCQRVGQVFRLRFGARDSSHCNASLGAEVDLWIKIELPPNHPPTLSLDLSGLNVLGDTICIWAESNVCIPFVMRDPDVGDSLDITGLGPLFIGSNAAILRDSGVNPIRGSICWRPDCQRADLVFPVFLHGKDRARCHQVAHVRDTFYIKVIIPPNRPPKARHVFAAGLQVSGDTIFADVHDTLCYRVHFEDPDADDSLSVFYQSAVFSSGQPPASLRTFGENPLECEVCWVPGCDAQGQTIQLVLGANDNALCHTVLQVYDTVWIKIRKPKTLPPDIYINLTATNHFQDTIYLDIGDSVCFEFAVIDRSTEEGFWGRYQFQDLGGSQLGYGDWTLQYRGDSLIGRACFKAVCADAQRIYRAEILGVDQATCPPYETARRYVYFKVSGFFYASAGPDIGFCEASGGKQLSVRPYGGRPPYQYQWGCTDHPNCGISNPHVRNPNVNPSKSTTFFVQMTDVDGCKSRWDSVEVEIHPLPIVDAGPDLTLCEIGIGDFLRGKVVNSGEAPGPYRWRWTPGKGLSDSTTSSPYARPDSTTIYVLIVTDARGCSSYSTTLDTLSTAVVRVGRRPEVDAGPDRHVCLGDSVFLLGAARGAKMPYRYEWTPQVGLNDPRVNVPHASPPHSFTYFFVAWSGFCPSDADSVTVHVHTLPTADPGVTVDVCMGDSVRLPGLAGGDSTSTYTYEWTPGIFLDDSTAQRPWCQPDSNMDYTVVATSSHHCVSPPYTMHVHVSPRPLVQVAPDNATICEGDSIQVRASHRWAGKPPSPPQVVYSWAGAGAINDRHAAAPWLSPRRSSLYQVTAFHLACSTTTQTMIHVTPKLEVLELRAEPGVLCSGDSLRLYGKGGHGDARFHWQGPGLSHADSFMTWASPGASFMYRLHIQEGPCKAEDSIFVAVHHRPSAAFDHSALQGCVPLDIHATAVDPEAVAYIWEMGDGTAISNHPAKGHRYEEAGTYRLRLQTIGTGGCASQREVSVQVWPLPEVDFRSTPKPGQAISGDEAVVYFESLSPLAYRWLWNFGDGKSARVSAPVHRYEEPGRYAVRLTITDAHGCSNTLIRKPYIVEDPSLFIPNVFSPNADGVNDVYEIVYKGSRPTRLLILDRWGVKIFEATPMRSWDGRMESGRPAQEGIYYVVFTAGEKTYKSSLTLLR